MSPELGVNHTGSPQAVRVRWFAWLDLGVTFSGLMLLVIDMTLTGPLNLGPETPSGKGNRWNRQIRELITLYQLALLARWVSFGWNWNRPN